VEKTKKKEETEDNRKEGRMGGKKRELSIKTTYHFPN
jgi:hypothetical protein